MQWCKEYYLKFEFWIFRNMTQSYDASKKAATAYQQARHALFSSVFSTWVPTPGTFQFGLDTKSQGSGATKSSKGLNWKL
jgi:hypothetical protein